MIPELGHFALILALGVALTQALLPAWGVWRRDARAMAVGASAAQAQFLLVAFAFGCLARCRSPTTTGRWPTSPPTPTRSCR
jgi:cytochrome c-type biogenesis protein CcmF